MKREMTEVGRQIYVAITEGNANAVRDLLRQNPGERDYGSPFSVYSWLHLAAAQGNVETVSTLLDLGIDVNTENPRPEKVSPGYFTETPLLSAVNKGRLDMVDLLLARGADPNIGRPLIAAINFKDDAAALQLVKRLVDHGGDPNLSFRWYGDDTMPAFTPLTWAEANEKEEIAAYLRSKGAVPPKAEAPQTPTTREAEVVAHLEKQFGPVRPQSLQEIVPTGLPISIHVIPPTKQRKHLTLFTTGMSSQPMTVPEGGEAYQYAELLIHLPGAWPLTTESLKDPNYFWPIEWLRNIARYPHASDTWLGGPFTVISNGDPPERLAPKIRFTAIMLAAKEEVHCRDGATVQLYTLFPLYPEEQTLERNQDLPALLRALDRAGIGDVVDLNRPNVAS